MFLTRKLGAVARPELRDIIAGFDSVALATREEMEIFDALSSHWKYFLHVAGKIDPDFHLSLADELKPLAQQSVALPKRADLPADDQERYAYLLNHIAYYQK